MNDDGDWRDLDDVQVVRLSEGFCPWQDTCRLGHAKLLRDDTVVDYVYCFLNDALARISAGEPEVLAMEDVANNNWKVVEWQM